MSSETNKQHTTLTINGTTTIEASEIESRWPEIEPSMQTIAKRMREQPEVLAQIKALSPKTQQEMLRMYVEIVGQVFA